jgi:predicted acetyltransferase
VENKNNEALVKDLFLAEPAKAYRESFSRYVLVYKDVNDVYYYAKYKKALDNFEEYIHDIQNDSIGINLPEGAVQCSTFWLIDQEEVVGVVRVRHQEVEHAGHIGYDISPYSRNKGYGTQILKLALEKAKAIGITEVILTCRADNIASRKIIEKNHGKLLEIVFDPEENEEVCKYKIPWI